MAPFDVHDGRRRERHQEVSLEGNRCHPAKRLVSTQRAWSGLTNGSSKARPSRKKFPFALTQRSVGLIFLSPRRNITQCAEYFYSAY